MWTSRWVGLVVLIVLGLAIAGCEEDDEKAKPIKVTGTSGDTVSLSGEWVSSCFTGSDGLGAVEAYDISGASLMVSRVEYEGTGESAPDCTGDELILFTLEAEVSRDVTEVTITDWVDSNGDPSTAPTGLEDVTLANGMEITLTNASLTPLTQSAADDLNSEGQCGITDWESGVTQEGDAILDCLLDGSSGDITSTWLVDDSTSASAHFLYLSPDSPGSFDENGFATEIQNDVFYARD